MVILKHIKSVFYITLFVVFFCFLYITAVQSAVISSCVSLEGQFLPKADFKNNYPVDLTAQYGIELTQINLTAENLMIDVRFRIKDPDKAKLFLEKTNRPVLTHIASGKSFVVPVTAKVGPLRQTEIYPQKDKIYFIFFGNHGRIIKSGDKVTLRFGETVIENMTVI